LKLSLCRRFDYCSANPEFGDPVQQGLKPGGDLLVYLGLEAPEFGDPVQQGLKRLIVLTLPVLLPTRSSAIQYNKD